MSDDTWVDRPETFLGMSYQDPAITMLGTMTTLPLPDDETEVERIAEQEQERKTRGIGFHART